VLDCATACSQCSTSRSISYSKGFPSRDQQAIPISPTKRIVRSLVVVSPSDFRLSSNYISRSATRRPSAFVLHILFPLISRGHESGDERKAARERRLRARDAFNSRRSAELP